jgi:hypothetical protein
MTRLLVEQLPAPIIYGERANVMFLRQHPA